MTTGRDRKAEMDGGEAILEALRRLGIEYIISSPGSEWAPMWEALNRQRASGTPGPNYIQCWHELLATDIAAGYTLMTGRPQAVLLHAASGILHGALGIYAANRAEVPMIVFSGESVTLGENPELPVEGQWYAGVSAGGTDVFVRPFTKWAMRVHSVETLYHSVIRARDMAVRTPKGPVYLDVPLEHMLAKWSGCEAGRTPPAAPVVGALAQDIRRVGSAISAAKNPIVVTEHSGADPRVFEALKQFSDAFVIPVVGAPGAAYANFPSNHPLWLGVGAYHHLKDADLVLLMGGRTPWYPPSKRVTDGRIVAISDHPMKGWLVYQNQQADEYLEGDIHHTLCMLLEEGHAKAIDGAALHARRDRWMSEHHKLVADLEEERTSASKAGTLTVPSICQSVRAHVPEDAIFLEETIMHAVALRKHLPIDRPSSFFRHPGGGLGQGIGLALGIKLASASRPVVLFVGDGSFLYNPIVQAFGASQEYSLPILIVVLNNAGYVSMGESHKIYYPDGIKTNADPKYGVTIKAPPLEQLAAPFGFFGARVSNIRQFDDALRAGLAAIASGCSAVINAIMST